MLYIWEEYLVDHKKHINNQMRGYDPVGTKHKSHGPGLRRKVGQILIDIQK